MYAESIKCNQKKNPFRFILFTLINLYKSLFRGWILENEVKDILFVLFYVFIIVLKLIYNLFIKIVLYLFKINYIPVYIYMNWTFSLFLQKKTSSFPRFPNFWFRKCINWSKTKLKKQKRTQAIAITTQFYYRVTRITFSRFALNCIYRYLMYNCAFY